MRKDGVSLLVAFCLFCSGVVWAQFFPDSEFWKSKFEFKLVDWFSVISAIATAVAAIAAWQAAGVAKAQAHEAGRHGRWQMYRMHREEFDQMLESAEIELNIRFFKKDDLYEAIFPRNRNIELPFSPVGSSELSSWINSCKGLCDFLCQSEIPNYRQIEKWMVDYVFLSSSCMRYKLHFEDRELYVGDGVATGINLDNHAEILKVLNDVLMRFSRFSYIEPVNNYRGALQEVEAAIHGHIHSVARSDYLGQRYKKREKL